MPAFIVFFVLFLFPLPLLAADGGQPAPPVPTATAPMPELVVTATALPQPEKDVPVHVQVIPEDEIKASGAADLSELLIQKLPGHIHKIPGATGVGIRGFRTTGFGGGPDFKDKVLILIDGHRSGIGNVALIPMENIERVEIVRGPGSVLYGASAMGGVINVITKKGHGKPQGRMAGEIGDFSLAKMEAGVSSGVLDDRLGFSLVGRTQSIDDYRIGRSGSKVENSAYQDEAVSGSFSWRPSGQHDFSIVGNYFNAEDIGAPGSIYFPSTVATSDELHQYASAVYTGRTENQAWQWQGSVYFLEHKYVFDDPDPFFPSHSATDTKGFGGRASITAPTFRFGSLTLGGELESMEDRHRGTVWSPDADYNIWAGFAEERLEFGSLVLYLGGRYDLYREETKDTKGLTVDAEEKTFQHSSWRGGAVYDLLSWLSVRGAVGTGFRPPAADELTGRYSHPYGNYTGNPDLKAETSLTYEGGLDVAFESVRAGLTYFHTDSDDTIVTVGSWPDYSWTNLDGQTLAGFEGYAEHRLKLGQEKSGVRIISSLDWTYFTERKNRDREEARAKGTDIPFYVSNFILTAGIRTEFAQLVALDLSARHTGGQIVEDFDPASSTYGKAKFKDAFTLYYAKLSVTPVEHLKFFFQIDNLLDERYSYVDGYYMPGRAMSGGMEFRF